MTRARSLRTRRRERSPRYAFVHSCAINASQIDRDSVVAAHLHTSRTARALARLLLLLPTRIFLVREEPEEQSGSCAREAMTMTNTDGLAIDFVAVDFVAVDFAGGVTGSSPGARLGVSTR